MTKKNLSSDSIKVSKGANIRNRYSQEPLDTSNEIQEFSPFPAGAHEAHLNRRAQRHSKHKTEKQKKIHKRSTALERSVKYFTGGLKPV